MRMAIKNTMAFLRMDAEFLSPSIAAASPPNELNSPGAQQSDPSSHTVPEPTPGTPHLQVSAPVT